MKTIKFRPLRRDKKTGKVLVAGYMQWRKMIVADYNEFNLVIEDMGLGSFNPDEKVYNHKFYPLFWYNHPDPEALRKSYVADLMDKYDLEGEEWKFIAPVTKGFHYTVKGFDCDGVPTFTHYTPDYIASHYYNDISELHPLSVGMVLKWYGWILYNLNKSRLHYK